MKKLRGYQAHSGDPQEWAILVFAFSAREARVLAWPTMEGFGVDLYTDVRVRWLRDCEPPKWGVTEPTVLESPAACNACSYWYDNPPLTSPIDAVLRCDDCEHLHEDELAYEHELATVPM